VAVVLRQRIRGMSLRVLVVLRSWNTGRSDGFIDVRLIEGRTLMSGHVEGDFRRNCELDWKLSS